MTINAYKLETPIAVVGLGISGTAILKLLRKIGYSDSQLTTFDDKNSLASFQNPEEMLKTFKPKTLVISPGVPLSKPWISLFKASGGNLTSEPEISFSLLNGERVVGVTGSVGKSTTVSILGEGLRAFSSTGFVGGNLGVPLADYIFDVLDKGRQRADWVVLELSSYQLESFKNLQCEIGVITYLTPNHMDRYDSLDLYYNSKLFLGQRCSKAVILNKNGGDLFDKTNSSFFFAAPSFYTHFDDAFMKTNNLTTCSLLGKHNLDNLAMSARVSDLAGWPSLAIKAMQKFPGLPHRLENLGVHKDILFVNDSKATTTESVLQAVHSLNSACLNGRLVLLLGGKDKNLPWENLVELANLDNLFPVFFGECRATIQAKSKLQGPSFDSLKLCLENIKPLLAKKDILLLSPGGTAWDEFKNFEERGGVFKNWVSSFWTDP